MMRASLTTAGRRRVEAAQLLESLRFHEHAGAQLHSDGTHSVRSVTLADQAAAAEIMARLCRLRREIREREGK